ncbi:aldo/keto reductase [Aureimonas sp. AU22]|uniref:aldo/keto reductase n=1 Tax=Aureimonas sp. AU22 TaxID=1638162 RepID=UPI000705D06A|nr:aldo/keto reductase [Aureimonas sp. AU22]BAT29974.1 oxidoreductase [Aureimonas sp. AU22]
MKIIEANGARIPAIGLGTYRLEGETCVRLVSEAIGIGYRHIDTARMYGNEAEVGQGVRASGIARDDIFVTTKVWTDDLAPADFARSAEAAVQALDIGTVDLLLIHWPNASIPLGGTIEALNWARDEGLTHHIGVANFPSELLKEASRLTRHPLVCNQVEYHPRLSQEKVRSACERLGMAMIAYSPIGQGKDLLADPVVVDMAERYGRTPAQIVLRWEVEQPHVGAIPRTSNPARLAENLDVFDFELQDEDRQRLHEMSRSRHRLVDPAFAPQWDDR